MSIVWQNTTLSGSPPCSPQMPTFRCSLCFDLRLSRPFFPLPVLFEAARLQAEVAAYIDAGRVHLLRLSDGFDRVVGDGTLARFTAAGLAYADGARVRLEPYNQLPS